MCAKKALKKAKRGTLIAFMSAFALFASFSSIDSEATSTYYIRTLFDEGSFGLVSQVIPDKGEGKEPLERVKGVDFSSIADYRKVYKGGGSNKVPGSSLIANIVLNDPTKVDETYEKVKTGGDKNMGLVFSFPGITQSIDVGEKTTYTALSSDMARAELVGNTLTKGMNDALMFIKTYSGAEHISGEGLRHIVAQLSRITAQFEQGGGADSFNTGKRNGGKGFSVTQVTGPNHNITGIPAGQELIPVNGLNYKDYVAITTTNEFGKVVYGYYPWRMAKGYHKDQVLAPLVGEEYVKLAKSKENRYLTWGQLAIQAGVNADLRSSDVTDSASDSMTLIGQGLGADLTGTITSVRSLLNLAPVQELILNMGARSSTHHRGVMTSDMYDTAKTVYVLVLVVSMLFLSVLVVRMIHQKMISTTNIIAKTSLMEGLQDIVFVGVMLAIFPSIFELLLELNYWIVETFSFSSTYLQAYGISGTKVLSNESLAGFVVSSMFLSIDVYINTTYLVRSIVVSFLFAISPIMTVSYAWGPTQKKLYFSYIRELVGNIFMQSFHAITMTFFAGYNTTNMSAMEAIASTYCFIPITQLFRSLVIGGQGGGFSEQLGGKLAGQLTNTATGLHKSNVAMRQSKEMFDMQANNAKALANANFGAQMTGMASDVLGMGVASMANSELGRSAIANKAGNMAKSSNGIVSKAGGALGKPGAGNAIGTGASLIAGGVGAFAGHNMMTGAHQDANKNLGEMQMKHSMENIGMGLSQAGIGMGVSSFDSGVGNSMIGAGMSSVEKGATKYGEGYSNAGVGGMLLAEGKGIDMGTDLAKSSFRRSATAMDNRYNKYQDGLRKDALMEAKEASKLAEMRETRGLGPDAMNTAVGMTGAKAKDNGGRFTNDTNPVLKYEPSHINNNNITQTLDLKKLDENYAGGNAILDYVKTLQDNDFDFSNPKVQKAMKEAEKDGMNMSYGTYGIGGLGDLSNQITIVTKDISKYGFEVRSDGEVLKTNSTIDTK